MPFQVNIYENSVAISAEVFDTKFVYPVLIETLNVKSSDRYVVNTLIENYKRLGKTNVNWRSENDGK